MAKKPAVHITGAVVLSYRSARALKAFMDAFDLYTSGQWTPIERAMREEFGITNPEDALEAARNELQKAV